MKQMTRVYLTNWLYYKLLMISFGMLNHLTGDNSSGKSTFLDALMIVLLGEAKSSNFNKAAGEKGRRSLKEYLYTDLNQDNQNLRHGKSFQTYIVCEFYDTVKMSFFCVGVLFDCFGDNDAPNPKFFLLKIKFLKIIFLCQVKANK